MGQVCHKSQPLLDRCTARPENTRRKPRRRKWPRAYVDKIYFLLIAVEISAVHFVYYIWRIFSRIMLILLQLQGKEYIWQLMKKT